MRRSLSVGSLGLVGVVLVGGILLGSEQPPALGDDDKATLETVLLDLIAFDKFDPAVGGGKRTRIVLEDRTDGSSHFLSEAQLGGEGHAEGERVIPPELRDDLRRRNAGGPVSLAAFRPASPEILVRDLADLKERGDFAKRYPEAKGYVVAWLPGYSRDRRSAVLRTWFGPTAHGATATYMLAKREGRWRVVWRDTAYYA